MIVLEEPSVDLSGATVIVTGANAGLGKELAAKLAAMNASKVVSVVCTTKYAFQGLLLTPTAPRSLL